jgi:hypothetical protein
VIFRRAKTVTNAAKAVGWVLVLMLKRLVAEFHARR